MSLYNVVKVKSVCVKTWEDMQIRVEGFPISDQYNQQLIGWSLLEYLNHMFDKLSVLQALQISSTEVKFQIRIM